MTAKVEIHVPAVVSDLGATLWVLDLGCKELFSLGHQAYFKHALDVIDLTTVKSSAAKVDFGGNRKLDASRALDMEETKCPLQTGL